MEKCPTGITGLDEITAGGLPRGRTTLVCGNAGSGKTLLGLEFLIKGTAIYKEPGVFVSFEETVTELTENVSSLGFNLSQLVAKNKIAIDHVELGTGDLEEAGAYDLEGLFIRLGHAIDSVQAKRVVLDTLESLLAGLTDLALLRTELRRLFHWLKEKGVTTIITGERSEGSLTKHGLEEYVSDCVILLDHRVDSQIATRRLRIIKYRGSSHGTNEYPFLLDEGGFDVLPVTSVGLDHDVSDERISSGLGRLDAMLGGPGYYRGSSVLVTGTAGVGKSSLAATFINAACKRGERAIYFAFEESQNQIVRNMRSIGVDLEPHIQNNLLLFSTARPTMQGLETHLARMYKMVRDFVPHVVVVDPINNFISVASYDEIQLMLMRLFDFLKSKQISGLFTSLTRGDTNIEETDVGVSSLIDTWLLLKAVEANGERNRVLYLLKSRGMAHSNQVREFVITSQGIDLIDVYTGPEGVLTGSARLAQEAKERAAAKKRESEIKRKQAQLEMKRRQVAAQISILRAEEEDLELDLELAMSHEAELGRDRDDMAKSRSADPNDTSERE